MRILSCSRESEKCAILKVVIIYYKVREMNERERNSTSTEIRNLIVMIMI